MSGYSIADTESEGHGEITQHKAYGDHVCMKYGSGSKWDGKRNYVSWYA